MAVRPRALEGLALAPFWYRGTVDEEPVLCTSNMFARRVSTKDCQPIFTAYRPDLTAGHSNHHGNHGMARTAGFRVDPRAPHLRGRCAVAHGLGLSVTPILILGPVFANPRKSSLPVSIKDFIRYLGSGAAH